MRNIKKLEKLLYIFILLNPIFDIFSGKLYIGSFSITMFLRPLIPFCLLIYIFIKDKEERKKLFIFGLIYVIYAFFHIYLYNKNITPFAYGNTLYEASYLINYTYLIFTSYLFIYVFKNSKSEEIYKYLFIHNMVYIVSIFIAILTNTSNPTYSEGIGYIGWFNTGGAVGSILVLSLILLLPKIFEDKKNLLIKILFLISTYGYLVFILGTRVGLFGAVISVILFILSLVFISFLKKIKISKKAILISLCIIVVFGILLYVFGSYTLERRKMLKDLEGKNPVDETAETIYMAYDLILLKEDIDKKNVAEDYMTDEQIDAIYELDKYTKENKYINTNLRGQQLLYHTYLYKNQDDILLKLFGNGYLNNMGMLTLEMETIALFYNFGIIGFVLYFLPFFIILIYGIIFGIKNIKKINIKYLMILSASLLSMGISFYSGHTYFNSSVMTIIIIINTLLIIEMNKIRSEKNEKNTIWNN